MIYVKCSRNKALDINFSIKDKRINKIIPSKREKFLWIFLVSIIVFLTTILYTIFCFDSNYLNDINTWLFDILFLSLFSRFILKLRLYKHHFLSIIMIGAFSFIDLSFDIIYYKGNFLKSIMNNLTHILFNLSYVLYKYFMLFKYLNYIEIVTFEGIIELFFGIITLIITTSIGYDNFMEFIYSINKNEVLYHILFVFLEFLYYLIVIKIIDNYSAFHIFLFNLSSELLISLINLILSKAIGFSILSKTISKPSYVFIINIIIIIVCIFSIMIYLEIIELNFFNLSSKIKRHLEKKAKIEAESDLETESIISEDDISIKGYSLNVINEKRSESIFHEDN